jgi:hypothetical protein
MQTSATATPATRERNETKTGNSEALVGTGGLLVRCLRLLAIRG